MEAFHIPTMSDSEDDCIAGGCNTTPVCVLNLSPLSSD